MTDITDNGWRVRIEPGLAGHHLVCTCQPDRVKARSLMQYEFLDKEYVPATPQTAEWALTYAACVHCKRVLVRLDKYQRSE